MDDREAVVSPDKKDTSPARDATNSGGAAETPWYHGALLPFGVSLFLLIGIGISYYQARRNQSRLTAGESGAAPSGLDGTGAPDTPASG
jgi:hypothetical protein